ncbi:MAG: hypothetical protein LBU39_11480 [Desulfobulbaceae bacterium]|jgi:hypothetical protein|nr:hypothetical protein [Desulfobulbaceae bacterium]
MKRFERLHKGLALALIQIAIVSSLGAKMLYDRHHLPRLWVKTASFDPNLPIRGRYARLQVCVEPDQALLKKKRDQSWQSVQLRVENGHLIAEASSKGKTGLTIWFGGRDQKGPPVLRNPLAFFLPEHVADPSRHPAGETLWAEVTVPPNGPPRPIRLGVQKGEGPIEPLSLQ